MVWTRFSPGIADAYEDAHQRRPSEEWAMEITYQYQLTSICTIQPDVQWVGDPVKTGRDALVIGLRSTFLF
jgi:carbohydrate-selective porin OprB